MKKKNLAIGFTLVVFGLLAFFVSVPNINLSKIFKRTRLEVGAAGEICTDDKQCKYACLAKLTKEQNALVDKRQSVEASGYCAYSSIGNCRHRMYQGKAVRYSDLPYLVSCFD